MTGTGQSAARTAAALAVVSLAAFASACATTRVTHPPATPPPGVAGLDGFAVATTALAFQGVPYRLGGVDPSGFDCSGLVQYVFAKHGRTLSRVVKQQYDEGRPVGEDDLRPGDLVFFATAGRQVSHVGIAIGGDRFVHAPNSRGVVRVESLGSEYWRRHYAGARRLQ
jgi:cell wall-associated NlpC family hydrolase